MPALICSVCNSRVKPAKGLMYAYWCPSCNCLVHEVKDDLKLFELEFPTDLEGLVYHHDHFCAVITTPRGIGPALVSGHQVHYFEHTTPDKFRNFIEECENQLGLWETKIATKMMLDAAKEKN